MKTLFFTTAILIMLLIFKFVYHLITKLMSNDISENIKNKKGNAKLIAVIMTVVIGLLLLLLLNPFVVINAGHRGVVLTWGKVSELSLEPGLHWRTPIAQRVVEMSVQTNKYEVPQSLAYSKDGQTIVITSAVNYNLDPSAVTNTYSEVGESYESKIIQPIVEDAIKQEIAQYAAVEIIANRGKIKDVIQTTLRERLSEFHILVTQYNLVNEDFDDAYEQAIADKQVAVERAKEAENQTKVVAQEKEQAVLRAQADAETSRLQAEALRTAGGEIVIEKIKAEAMLEASKKWKGEVPASVTVLGNGQAIPFLNLK